jgi:hypothetical protein
VEFLKLCKNKGSGLSVASHLEEKPIRCGLQTEVASGKNSCFSVNIDKPLLTCSFSRGTIAQYPVLSGKRPTLRVPRVKVTVVGDLREDVN